MRLRVEEEIGREREGKEQSEETQAERAGFTQALLQASRHERPISRLRFIKRGDTRLPKPSGQREDREI